MGQDLHSSVSVRLDFERKFSHRYWTGPHSFYVNLPDLQRVITPEEHISFSLTLIQCSKINMYLRDALYSFVIMFKFWIEPLLPFVACTFVITKHMSDICKEHQLCCECKIFKALEMFGIYALCFLSHSLCTFTIYDCNWVLEIHIFKC